MHHKRISWIDIAKGFAILGVIFGHSSLFIKQFSLNQILYPFHLMLFFILSGYTLKEKEVTKDFVNQKFQRLMIPYFLTCIAILFMDVFNCIVLTTILNVTRLISGDLLRSFFASGSIRFFGSINIGGRIGAIWFLPAMFFAIIIVQLLLKFCKNDKIRIIISIFIFLLGFISAKFLWLPFSIQSSMTASFFILLGYLLRKYHILDQIKYYHYIFFIIFGIFGEYTETYFVNNSFNDIFLNSVVGFSECILVIGISKFIRTNKVFEWIGKNSLTILCIHLFELETMNPYYKLLLKQIHIPNSYISWVTLGFRLIFVFGVTLFLLFFKKRFSIYHETECSDTRNKAIDLMKGILILSMIVGQFKIDDNLRKIIFSCHVSAFIFLSGYCYKKKKKPLKQIQNLFISFFIPYLIFGILYFILHWNQLSYETILKTMIVGISFAKNIFTSIPSIGPIYFIFLLFLIRLFFIILDSIFQKDFDQLFVAFILSMIGYFLGQYGFWCPWSFDLACYGMIFYVIGVFMKKYNLLETMIQHSIFYFGLSPILVYMIYQGSMEIAIRKLNPYGLILFGSLAGIILLYMACKKLETIKFIRSIFIQIGQSTFGILIIHTLFSSLINRFVTIRFNPSYIYSMFFSLVIQVVIGIVFQLLINFIFRFINQKKSHIV